MAKLTQIDTRKRSRFSGFVMRVSDDPYLVKLAQEQGNQNLRLISQTVTDLVFLSANQTRSLLRFIRGGPWHNEFEKLLQCISCDDEGDLLTTWMPLDRFDDFLCSLAEDEALRRVAEKLRAETEGWRELGVQEVYYDAYRKD